MNRHSSFIFLKLPYIFKFHAFSRNKGIAACLMVSCSHPLPEVVEQGGFHPAPDSW